MTAVLKEKIKKKKGFTLIELIIVVAIIAILAALVIPKLMGTQENSKKKADIANAKIIHDTVAKLMTEDKITPNEQITFDVDKVDSKATEEDKKTEKVKTQDALATELQNIPKPKFKPDKNSKFIVIINKDTKNIQVKAVDDKDEGKEVYPNTDEEYKK